MRANKTVPIITKVVSSNPAHGEVYLIQHYVIKFVSDLRQVGGFLQSVLLAFGVGNRSILRKPPTCRKSLTNFIT
jgi:hypothetical protein